MNLNLKNKKVFISGSTKGIGYETARLFLDEGAQVIINGRTKSSVDDALSKLNNKNASGIVTDFLDDSQVEKLLDEIDNVLDDKANFIEQDHSKATYAPKIDKSEGRINWNEKAEQILGKVNGLYPVPGAWFNFAGERYKILKSKIGNAVGKVGEVTSDELEIICGDNKSLKILEIQRQGKRVQSINEFMLGSRIKKGMILPND